MPNRIIAFLLLSGCLACVRPKANREPAPGPHFQSLSIKFNFSDGRVRQNGRVHWRFDDLNAKFLFFTPLNQVGLELVVSGETALLSRPGKKLYWRGEFALLLDRLWGIELTLAELKGLILAGALPAAKARENDITVDPGPDPGSRPPRLVTIRRKDSVLTLKITGTRNPGRSHRSARSGQTLSRGRTRRRPWR